MIELMSVEISSQETIVSLRNKIAQLLLQLSYKDMETIRLVTKISYLLQHIYCDKKNFRIRLGFKKDYNSYHLIMMISEISSLSAIKKYCLVPNASYLANKDGKNEIHIRFNINNENFIPNSKYITGLKEQLIVQSKAELMREVINKNQELNKLVEHLKQSADLIQSEKMRALGVLTAGVAHELNNPMMGILNFIQYSIKKTSLDDKRYEALTEAEHETKRCIDIIKNLLTFSHLEKQEEENFKPVNIVLIVERVLNILSYRLRNEGISVQKNIPDNIPSVMGHENRLQQVILNLVVNALDAMKKVSKKCLTIKLKIENDKLIITVSDTGEGMDAITEKNIFEPFFTTKPTGLGTGLGLSVCHSIIKEHQGTITFHTKKNEGTEFFVTLPFDNKEH